MSLAELYRDQPLLVDVAAFPRPAGFVLIELEPAFRDVRTDELLQLNAFFVKRRA